MNYLDEKLWSLYMPRIRRYDTTPIWLTIKWIVGGAMYVEIVSAFEHDSLKTCVLLYVHIMIYTNYIINTFMYHKLIKKKAYKLFILYSRKLKHANEYLYHVLYSHYMYVQINWHSHVSLFIVGSQSLLYNNQ